jgi:sortase A
MKRISPAQLPPERILVPEIGLDAPVVPMTWQNVVQDGMLRTEWIVPAEAAGYQVGSAFPGQVGNTVISGHHNIEGKVFENLRHLVPGDSIYVHTAEDVFHYVVEDSFLLHELNASLEQKYENARWIGPTADERLTLVTCWPPTGNAYRLIIVAKPRYFDSG